MSYGDQRRDPGLVEEIDAVLPQTQCGKCGYSSCHPYAQAIATSRADINRCPPGGDETIAKIASLLGVARKPLDPAFGATRSPAIAMVEEEHCIGCTLCIQVCPMDAIVGAAKLMHTVIAGLCTGCELCVPPCPVDCIRLVPFPQASAAPRISAADARSRFEARTRRLNRQQDELAQKVAAQRAAEAELRKKETIARVLERARRRL